MRVSKAVKASSIGTLAVAVGAAALFSGSLLAQDAGQGIERDPAAEFDLADFDHNDCVNWEELRNRSMIVFGGLDANSDGVITADELQHVAAEGTEVPADTSVDLKTLQSRLRVSFDEEDADGSGCIDRSEWT